MKNSMKFLLGLPLLMLMPGGAEAKPLGVSASSVIYSSDMIIACKDAGDLKECLNYSEAFAESRKKCAYEYGFSDICATY
jgi:hypothetical protein